MNSVQEPHLDPPGAGLPAAELFIARRLFALKRLTGTREGFAARFRQERAAIRALVDRCDEARRGERVLIARRRGMEVSSRNWSVWMTLDHLCITNSAFQQVITALAQGRVLAGKASTAAVKPDPAVTAAVESEYERSCDGVLTVLAEAPDLKTKVRYAHPWFGPLDAFGWAALAATHMGVHRGQIESIVAGLT